MLITSEWPMTKQVYLTLMTMLDLFHLRRWTEIKVCVMYLLLVYESRRFFNLFELNDSIEFLEDLKKVFCPTLHRIVHF